MVEFIVLGIFILCVTGYGLMTLRYFQRKNEIILEALKTDNHPVLIQQLFKDGTDIPAVVKILLEKNG